MAPQDGPCYGPTNAELDQQYWDGLEADEAHFGIVYKDHSQMPCGECGQCTDCLANLHESPPR